MRRQWALALGLLLAGCGGGVRPEVAFQLPIFEETPAPSAQPVGVAAARPTPSVGPSAVPPGSSGGSASGGGGAPAAPTPRPGELGFGLATGDQYRLARVAGDAAGGLDLGTDGLSARFGAVAGLVVAPDGTIYACDPVNHQVRAIPPAGATSVVAGDAAGASGYFGDNVPAVSSRLNGPTGLARDPGTGALFVADTGNGRVRVFAPGGRIYTIAGGGGSTADTVSSANLALLQQPCGLAVDSQRRLYVSDRGTGKLRRVEADGKLVTVATFAPGALGAIACDRTGDRVWVAEGGRVWLVSPGATPAVSAAPVYEVPGGAVMGLTTDQAGSLFVLATSVAPLGRKDTHVVRLATEVAGRAPVVLAGKDGQGATSADYTVPAAGLEDAGDQWLAAGGLCGLAIDIAKAADPDAASGFLYQANTYDDGAGVRWGQVNRLTPVL